MFHKLMLAFVRQLICRCVKIRIELRRYNFGFLTGEDPFSATQKTKEAAWELPNGNQFSLLLETSRASVFGVPLGSRIRPATLARHLSRKQKITHPLAHSHDLGCSL